MTARAAFSRETDCRKTGRLWRHGVASRLVLSINFAANKILNAVYPLALLLHSHKCAARNIRQRPGHKSFRKSLGYMQKR
jgi:hypothetical protein